MAAMIPTQKSAADVFLGYLNKKSKYRKQWKRRFFEIKGECLHFLSPIPPLMPNSPSLPTDGLIKYYTTTTTNKENLQIGNGLRGIFDLTGVQILPLSLESPCQISLITPQDRQTEIALEAETIEEVYIEINLFSLLPHSLSSSSQREKEFIKRYKKELH
jgi:hypothetical protein